MIGDDETSDAAQDTGTTEPEQPEVVPGSAPQAAGSVPDAPRPADDDEEPGIASERPASSRE